MSNKIVFQFTKNGNSDLMESCAPRSESLGDRSSTPPERLHKKAIDDYNQWISLDPNSAKAYYERACCYSYCDVRDYQQSLLDFNQAISLDTNYLEAYIGRGTLYYLLGEYQKALVDLNQSLSLDKDGIRTPIITLLIMGASQLSLSKNSYF
jgi:tetratricopeptide (TPR) repeat protein